MTRWILGVLMAIVVTVGNASAEILHFREGGKVVAPITRDGEDVLIDTAMGVLRFPESDFAKIEEGGTFTSAWIDRRDDARSKGPDDRRDAALWALSHGFVPEAEAMLRSSLADAPDHADLKRLVATLDRLNGECADPPMGPLRRNLPEEMRIARGPHVLMVHDLTDAEAEERVNLIETVIKAYYLDLAAMGFDLPEPREKLASIFFSREADYVSWLRNEGATGFLNTRGFYQPTRRVVVAYDSRSDPLRIQADEGLARRRDELSRMGERIAKMPPGARMKVGAAGQPARVVGHDEAEAMLAGLGRQVDRQRMMLELSRREIDLGVAAHETIHQLVALTKLAPSHDRFPNWLHEGLAMQYETIRAGRWAGLSQPSELRLVEYRKITPPPALGKALLPSSLGQGYSRDGYATAWAVVFYLRQERPSAFVAILDRLRAPALTSQIAPNAIAETLETSVKTTILDEQARWHETMKAITIP